MLYLFTIAILVLLVGLGCIVSAILIGLHTKSQKVSNLETPIGVFGILLILVAGLLMVVGLVSALG